MEFGGLVKVNSPRVGKSEGKTAAIEEENGER
jgi:hypothetical protein